jgi:hypothetical protein
LKELVFISKTCDWMIGSLSEIIGAASILKISGHWKINKSPFFANLNSIDEKNNRAFHNQRPGSLFAKKRI